MSKALIVIVVLVLIGVVGFGKYVGVRNTLVTKNESVKAAWSQVDIVLQRRADLIPNLVETVKGYAQQDSTVFGDIAKARSALLSAGTPSEKIAANQQLDGASGTGCWLIVENYPQSEIERELHAPAGRVGGNGEPHRRGAQALQRQLCRTTTPTCSSSPITSLRDGQGSKRMTRTLRQVRERAMCRK